MEIARKMKAKNVILTHFSQRYPKMPSLNNVKLDQNTVVAFDHMKVSTLAHTFLKINFSHFFSALFFYFIIALLLTV